MATRTLLLAALALTLCASGGRAARRGDDGIVQLAWPGSSHDQALAAYMASSLMPVLTTEARPTLDERLAGPPFVTGEGRVALDLAAFDEVTAAAFRKAATAAGSGQMLSMEAFFPVAEERYLAVRYFSANLPALHQYLGFPEDPAWVKVDVRSIISGGVRRVWFHVKPVLEGTLDCLESGRPLVFPRDAWFVAEHLDASGTVVETHVTGKRVDWEWDYGLYDRDGIGQVSIGGRRPMPDVSAPSSCYSCHEISARVSPFAEFPAASDPIGGLLPEVLVTLSPAERLIVQKLCVPKGVDQVMGQYGGLAALKVRAWRQAGTAPAWSAPLWDRLVKLVPELESSAGR